jgi:hypothetical protein
VNPDPLPPLLLELFELHAAAASATVARTTIVDLIPLVRMPDPPLIASCGAQMRLMRCDRSFTYPTLGIAR